MSICKLTIQIAKDTTTESKQIFLGKKLESYSDNSWIYLNYLSRQFVCWLNIIYHMS